MARSLLAVLALSSFQQYLGTVTAFSCPRSSLLCRIGGTSRITSSHKLSDDDWGLEDSSSMQDEDPRVAAMRSMLESSWDGEIMGVVPSNSEKAAEAASESIADALGRNRNILMIDLRLPSYDITEGPKLYDLCAAYDFCGALSDNLRRRKLIRKSLILVRNEMERGEIDRATSQRDGRTINSAEEEDDDDDIGEDDEEWETTTIGELEEEGSEVDEFRKTLMASWEPTSDDTDNIDVKNQSPPPPSSGKKTSDHNNNLSRRLWSMLGSEEISDGPDMFNEVIAAVDENARLDDGEDALIILSPFDTADVICLRRIMARYGQSRTIIIVNSRIETLPKELDPALLVYGVIPLIARSKGNDDGREAGLKAVVMKRYPADWTVYVDIGAGFVEAKGSQPLIDSSEMQVPSPEWISQRVQAFVKGLPKQ